MEVCHSPVTQKYATAFLPSRWHFHKQRYYNYEFGSARAKVARGITCLFMRALPPRDRGLFPNCCCHGDTEVAPALLNSLLLFMSFFWLNLRRQRDGGGGKHLCSSPSSPLTKRFGGSNGNVASLPTLAPPQHRRL